MPSNRLPSTESTEPFPNSRFPPEPKPQLPAPPSAIFGRSTANGTRRPFLSAPDGDYQPQIGEFLWQQSLHFHDLRSVHVIGHHTQHSPHHHCGIHREIAEEMSSDRLQE